MFALIVKGRKNTIVPEGHRFWVIKEPEGWVEATSTYYTERPPNDLLTFTTEAEAKEFGKQWKGHPWWCSPRSCQVVKVKEVTKVVFSHYEIEE